MKNKQIQNMDKLLTLVGVTVSLLFASCEKPKEKHEAVRLLVTTPLKIDTLTTKEYVCQIRAIRHIELRALEKGYLQNYYVDEGKFVKKGQQMFQILPLLYKAEMQKAQAEAEFAKIEYLNTKSLHDSNVVSKNELAMAKAKYDKAQAELSLAQIHLGFTQIRAPFDGIMNRLNDVRQGSLLNEGDLLSTISDISQMWVYFNVPEAEYLDYKTNLKNNTKMEVKLRMANNEVFHHTGTVETIQADFNNETGNIAFRATFPNPEKLLRHGETGNIIVEVPLKDALIIPQKATYEILNSKYVFVVGADSVIKSREVTIAAEIPDLYVIAEGLKENEKILLEGLRLVNDGDKINYDYKKPREVISHLSIHAE